MKDLPGILARGDHILGNMWTSPTQPAAEDLKTLNSTPGLVAQFRTAASEVALLPQLVDHELLEGTTELAV